MCLLKIYDNNNNKSPKGRFIVLVLVTQIITFCYSEAFNFPPSLKTSIACILLASFYFHSIALCSKYLSCRNHISIQFLRWFKNVILILQFYFSQLYIEQNFVFPISLNFINNLWDISIDWGFNKVWNVV